MNVLFTCAGRRSYLLRYFKEAMRATDSRDGLVLAADMSGHAPALAEADRGFLVPSIYAPEYLDCVLRLAEEQHADLLVPLNDLELPLLAANVARFRDVGTTVVVSSPEVIDICFDKERTSRFLTEIGIATPRTFFTLNDALAAVDRGELAFPLVVKPRWGSASIGLEFPQDRRELELAFELVQTRLDRSILADASRVDRARAIMIQERLGGPEYGLDVVDDLAGNHAATFVKQKLGMRGGETDRAKTVHSPELEAVGRRIAQHLRHTGNLDCDAFIVDGKPYILEMNPRFGGGYPFSHIAGANVPAALMAWHRGEVPDADWLRVEPGIVSAKFDTLVRAASPASM